MEENLHSYTESSSSSSSSSEDYINMEVDSSFNSSIFGQSSNKEFEFQSFSSSSDRDHTTTSPADELFYMGKLLPLHLPPRLEMVHKILQNPTKKDIQSFEDESFSTPLFTPSANTPFESCNISPSESCEVSRELNPEEHFVEYLADIHKKKSWTKKLKLIKQSSSSGSKTKWTSYLKSLFTKSSGCSDEYSATADQKQLSKPKQCAKNCAPFGQIKYNKDDNLSEDHRGNGHRRSFSGAFKMLSKTKTSSSTSLNRNVYQRSVSSSSEIDNPIQAAIAHCKKSSRVAYDDQERSGLCTIAVKYKI